MTIQNLLKDARRIWQDRKMSVDEIAIAAGVVTGDIQRYARDTNEGKMPDPDDLRKELGNIIFSAVRWCDDLGYDPEACIALAKEAQTKYQTRR